MRAPRASEATRRRNAIANRRGAAIGGVDVHEHLLGGRDWLVLAVAQQYVEQVHPLVIPAQQLGRHLDAIAGEELAQVRQVRLDRVVAAAALEVAGVDADERSSASVASANSCRYRLSWTWPL